jgi:RNase P subunit RPR2
VTALRSGFDLVIDVAGSATWALAVFFITARLVSTEAGGLLALAVFVSAMTMVISGRSQETRARDLAAGTCPSCRGALVTEHNHRRWDTTHSKWLAPLTTWRCAACGAGHDEPVACERCPAAD